MGEPRIAVAKPRIAVAKPRIAVAKPGTAVASPAQSRSDEAITQDIIKRWADKGAKASGDDTYMHRQMTCTDKLASR